MALTKATYFMVDGAPVNVLDYGATLNDSSAGVRTANKAALVAAMATGKQVFVPKGTLWIDGDIEFISDAYIFGEGPTLTTIKGSGDLFKVTVNFGSGIFRDLALENDATLGKLYKLLPPQDSGHAMFINVNFGDAQYHTYGSTFATVNPIFENCRFRGATVASRYYTSLWAYKENNCYTWYNNVGLFVNGMSMGCSVNNSVFEHQNNQAVKLSAPNLNQEHLSFSVNNTYFEFNGKNATPDVTIETSAATRIRAVTFNNCIIQNPDAATTPARVQIIEGGGGNIDNVVFSACSVIGALPLVTDTSKASLVNTYVAAGVAGLSNVKIPSAFAGVTGQVAPTTTPSAAWNQDFTQTTITIANNGTYDLATGSGLISFIGVGGDCAGVVLCALGFTVLIGAVPNSVTVTSGTANRLNVFYNAGTSKYRLQNLLGADTTMVISMQRLRTTP